MKSVALANPWGYGLVVVVLLGRMPASAQRFAPARTYSTCPNSHPVAIALSDVNRDGHLDVVVANCHADNVGVLLGRGNGRFAPLRSYATGRSSRPNGLAVGDLNGDGWPDVAVANPGADNVGVLLGNATGGLAALRVYPTGPRSQPADVVVADLNGDQRPDLVAARPGTDSVGVWFGQAGGGLTAPVRFATPPNTQPHVVVPGDLNGDGYPDLVVTTSQEDSLGLLMGRAGGRWGPVRYVFAGAQSFPSAVAVGDVNGDGRPDVVFSQQTLGDAPGQVGLLLGQAPSGFAPVRTLFTGTAEGAFAVGVCDLTADGTADVVWASYGSGQVGVLPGRAGGFGPPQHFATGRGRYRHPSQFAVGDVNGDGRLDVVVVNTGADNVGVLLQTGPPRR